MSYAQTGDFVICDDIRITAAIARGLENLVDQYIARHGGKQQQDDEALKAIAAVVADRLENMSEDAKTYVDTRSIEYREITRAARKAAEADLDPRVQD